MGTLPAYVIFARVLRYVGALLGSQLRESLPDAVAVLPLGLGIDVAVARFELGDKILLAALDVGDQRPQPLLAAGLLDMGVLGGSAGGELGAQQVVPGGAEDALRLHMSASPQARLPGRRRRAGAFRR